jgi:hypothetical protein
MEVKAVDQFARFGHYFAEGSIHLPKPISSSYEHLLVKLLIFPHHI